MRGKVTFERSENKYIGTSFTSGGQTPDFKLILEVKKAELTADQKTFFGVCFTYSSSDDKGRQGIELGYNRWG